MLPTITAFMAAYQLADVTVVADAWMISAGNKQGIEAAGLPFVLGTRVPDIRYLVQEWRRTHEAESPPDGLILTQPRPAGPRDRRRDEPIYYQYRADRASRSSRSRRRRVGRQGRTCRGQGPHAGRVERSLHQPQHLPRRRTGHRSRSSGPSRSVPGAGR